MIFVFKGIGRKLFPRAVWGSLVGDKQRKNGIASLASLPETYQILHKTCRDFAENELRPIAAKTDREQCLQKKQVLS